jgi:cytochrome c oxidase subunit III
MANNVVMESVEFGGGRSGGNGGAFGNGGRGDNYSGAASVPQRTYVTGMMIALGGILMFFVALVSAWIVRKGFPNSDWQPLDIPRILWLNTLILAASSFTLARSRRCLLADRVDEFRHQWGVTTILGVFFLAGQLVAWWQLIARGVFLATNPGSSFFYVFTAAHGLHLLGGIAALLVVALRPPRLLTLDTATKVVAMYWHFMGGVWLFLFALLLSGR